MRAKLLFFLFWSLWFKVARSQAVIQISAKNLTNCKNSRCDYLMEFSANLTQPKGEMTFVDPYRKYNDTKIFMNGKAVFSLTAAQRFPITDFRYEDQMICTCPASSTEGVANYPCSSYAKSPTDILWDRDVSIEDNRDTDCPWTNNPAKCCYILKVNSLDYFEVYAGITTTFESLQISYDNKDYNLVYDKEVQMVHLNVTLESLINVMLPFNNMAILMDANGLAKIVDKNLINTPKEHDTKKVGWWKQNPESSKIDFDQFPTQVYPRNTRWQSNLHLPQARNLDFFSSLTVRPEWKNTPGTRLSQARIVTKYSTELAWFDYSGQNPTYNNYNLTVDDTERLVCISYPSICVCTPGTVWNIQRCLSIRGKIRIFNSDNSIGYALIDTTWTLSQDVYSNLKKMKYTLDPPQITIKVRTDQVMGTIRLDNAAPYSLDAYAYTSQSRYIIINIEKLPCSLLLETDKQKDYMTVSTANFTIYIDWVQPIFTIYDVTGSYTVLPRKLYEDTKTTYIPTGTDVYDAINQPGSLLQAMLKQLNNGWFWFTVAVWILTWWYSIKKHRFDWSSWYLTFGLVCLFPFWALLAIPLYFLWCFRKNIRRRYLRSQRDRSNQQADNHPNERENSNSEDSISEESDEDNSSNHSKSISNSSKEDIEMHQIKKKKKKDEGKKAPVSQPSQKPYIPPGMFYAPIANKVAFNPNSDRPQSRYPDL